MYVVIFTTENFNSVVSEYDTEEEASEAIAERIKKESGSFTGRPWHRYSVAKIISKGELIENISVTHFNYQIP